MAEVRRSRAWLVIEGERVPVIEADVTVHRYQSSDTFNATLPVDVGGFDEAFWADSEQIDCELIATNFEGEGGETQLLTGQVDQVEIIWETRTVRVSGRDKTAKLLDRKTHEKFQDRSSSEIVEEKARAVGLTVETDTTQDRAGKQYTQGHDRITDHENDWSLIVALAEREGKVAFIKGDTLYFKSPGNEDGDKGTYVVRYTPPSNGPAQGDFIRLRTKRNLVVAKKVKATVRSFDRRKKKVITAEKEIDGTGDDGDAAHYEYTVPGLTQQEADAIADKKVEENSRHERLITLDMPGDVELDPRMMLRLTGTRTKFDQTYFIDSIHHHFDFGEDDSSGHAMTVSAKNKSEGRKKS